MVADPTYETYPSSSWLLRGRLKLHYGRARGSSLNHNPEFKLHVHCFFHEATFVFFESNFVSPRTFHSVSQFQHSQRNDLTPVVCPFILHASVSWMTSQPRPSAIDQDISLPFPRRVGPSMPVGACATDVYAGVPYPGDGVHRCTLSGCRSRMCNMWNSPGFKIPRRRNVCPWTATASGSRPGSKRVRPRIQWTRQKATRVCCGEDWC